MPSRLLLALLFACLPWSTALGQLRIVSWNIAGGVRTGTSDVLEAIGLESVNDFAAPIDVLSLQETDTDGDDLAAVVAALNGIYGAGEYAAAPIPAAAVSSGAGLPGLVYRVDTVDLLASTAFGVVNTSAQARSTLRYHLRPDGYEEDAEFYVYSNHYKASTGSSNEARREVEATALRADLDALGDGVAAILTGDFNIRDSFEDSYQTLLSAGPGQAFDPIDTPGDWHDDASFRHVHTQSPVTSSSYGGQVTGGMDDRFDFQLVTGELLDGEGLDYLSGSYRVFGNNGTHSLNGAINSGSGASSAVLSALMNASDHLPVIADYALPALTLTLAGDFNEDGAVDLADYSVWRDGLGITYDASDYLDWRDNFGAVQASATAGVPEPGILAMLGVSVVPFLLGRRRAA